MFFALLYFDKTVFSVVSQSSLYVLPGPYGHGHSVEHITLSTAPKYAAVTSLAYCVLQTCCLNVSGVINDFAAIVIAPNTISEDPKQNTKIA